MANKTGRSTVTGGATRQEAAGVTPQPNVEVTIWVLESSTLRGEAALAGATDAAGACRRAAKHSGSRQPNVVTVSRRRFR